MSSAADVLNAYAFQFMRAGDYPTAAFYLHKAIDADPNNCHALNNLASTYKALGREPESIALYERLVREFPDYLPPFNNLAFSRLRMGDYADGWQMYRHRLQAHAKYAVDYGTPKSPLTGRSLGEEPLPSLADLRNRHVLIVQEQGLGDELFFLRFVDRLYSLARPENMWYAPSPKLYPLSRRWDAPVVATDSSFFHAPKDDAVAVPLADLPLICSHDGTWFPESLKITTTDDLPAHADGAIGVTWRAGVAERVHTGTLYKGVSPAALGAALRAVERPIVIMQRGASDKEIDEFNAALGRIADVFPYDGLTMGTELQSIAARLKTLHTYVGVSNTNMHLLAAVGGTAHVLVPLPSEWRWPLTHETTSPWFPGFKVYRQTIMEGWDTAMANLAGALAE